MSKWEHRSVYKLKQQLGSYFRINKKYRERIAELEEQLELSQSAATGEAHDADEQQQRAETAEAKGKTLAEAIVIMLEGLEITPEEGYWDNTLAAVTDLHNFRERLMKAEAQRDAALGDVESLKTDGLCGTPFSAKAVGELREQRDAARDVCQEYGRHKLGCVASTAYIGQPSWKDTDCTCGWVQARAVLADD